MKCNTKITSLHQSSPDHVSCITRNRAGRSQVDVGRAGGSKSSLTRHTSIRSQPAAGSRETLLMERERPQVEVGASSRRRLHRPVAALAYWPRMHVFGELPSHGPQKLLVLLVFRVLSRSRGHQLHAWNCVLHRHFHRPYPVCQSLH